MGPKIETIKVDNHPIQNAQIGKNYADLILRIIKQPPAGKGFTHDEMEIVIPLKKKIEGNKEDSVIELTPAEFRKIKEGALSFPWAFIDEEIYEFNLYLKNL